MGEKYEAVFIIKENKDEENIKNIIKNIIESEKCKIFKEETIGNKKLAYEIKGEKRGIFYLLNFEVKNKSKDVKGSISMKINTIEDVLKHIVIIMNED